MCINVLWETALANRTEYGGQSGRRRYLFEAAAPKDCGMTRTTNDNKAAGQSAILGVIYWWLQF